MPDFRRAEGLAGRLKDIYFRFLGMPFYQRRVEAVFVFPALGQVRGGQVLDLGCGDGLFSIELARRGALVEALDISSTALDRARWRAKELGLSISFVHGSATRLPYQDSYFDIVLSNCVLEHIPEDVKVLQEISRVLKPGGRMVITVPGDFALASRVPLRLARALYRCPRWLRRWLGSSVVKQAESFKEYAHQVIIPYEQVRFGYAQEDIAAKIGQAGLTVEAVQGYMKVFGALGVDLIEALSAFEVQKGGDFGYTGRHEWLYGLAFPVFYALSFLDHLLPASSPSLALAISASKPKMTEG